MSLSLLTSILIGLAAALILKRLLGGGGATPEQLAASLAAGALVVDVRTPGEFRAGAYPGARNIPLQELGGRLAEIPADRPAILYCASGARSAAAARMLAQAGHAQVLNAGPLSRMPRKS